uniref:Uncharacterized protein n=1 Tax=Anopheles culicifacies TaxID=139723 RepID=A0A182LTK4_9DIPT
MALRPALGTQMHEGYSTPAPKMRQYGSMLICSPARFVKKTAMAEVVLNEMAKNRSCGHQAIVCALPPIGIPSSNSFISSVVTKSRCRSSRDHANDCSEPLAVLQPARVTRCGGTVQR